MCLTGVNEPYHSSHCRELFGAEGGVLLPPGLPVAKASGCFAGLGTMLTLLSLQDCFTFSELHFRFFCFGARGGKGSGCSYVHTVPWHDC